MKKSALIIALCLSLLFSFTPALADDGVPASMGEGPKETPEVTNSIPEPESATGTMTLAEVTSDDIVQGSGVEGTTPVYYPNSEFLWNINVTNSKLSPAFHRNSFEYILNADIGYSSSDISVIPDDPAASVTINGTATKSITLSLDSGGVTQADILVTSPDGLRSNSYKINMTPRSSDATLSDIDVYGDLLTPSFSPSVLNYTVTPMSSYWKSYVSITVNDPFATATINGANTGGIKLALHDADYPEKAFIEVTAADGVTKTTYTVTVSETSNNADLAGITVGWGPGTGSITPDFKPDITNYTVKPSLSGTGVKICLGPVDRNGWISGTGVYKSGDSEYSIWFGSAANMVQRAEVVVTASDRITKKTYILTLDDPIPLPKKDPIPSPSLSDVSISAGVLSRAFSATTYSYTITLGENEPNITLTPVKAYDGAKMTINGNAVPSTTFTVSNGKTVKATVKVVYGKATKKYKFTIKRLKSTNNNLSMLSPSVGSLNVPFDSNVTNYTLNLDEYTKSVAIRAGAESGFAKVSPAAKSVSLKNGQTKAVKFTVRAQSGARKVYTVTVTRAPSTNTALKTLKVSPTYPISSGFSPDVTDYTVTLPADKGRVSISAKAADILSKVTIDGIKKSSVKATLLNGQSITFRILVTSQAGTTREYTVTVQRQ